MSYDENNKPILVEPISSLPSNWRESSSQSTQVLNRLKNKYCVLTNVDRNQVYFIPEDSTVTTFTTDGKRVFLTNATQFSQKHKEILQNKFITSETDNAFSSSEEDIYTLKGKPGYMSLSLKSTYFGTGTARNQTFSFPFTPSIVFLYSIDSNTDSYCIFYNNNYIFGISTLNKLNIANWIGNSLTLSLTSSTLNENGREYLLLAIS